MGKFKVGDRVRITCAGAYYQKGETGTVMEDHYVPYILIDDADETAFRGRYSAVSENNLEKIVE